MLTNKQTFSDVVILLAKVLIHIFCVLTKVLLRKMIQLLSTKTTPDFHLLPMPKVDQS